MDIGRAKINLRNLDLLHLQTDAIADALLFLIYRRDVIRLLGYGLGQSVVAWIPRLADLGHHLRACAFHFHGGAVVAFLRHFLDHPDGLGILRIEACLQDGLELALGAVIFAIDHVLATGSEQILNLGLLADEILLLGPLGLRLRGHLNDNHRFLVELLQQVSGTGMLVRKGTLREFARCIDLTLALQGLRPQEIVIGLAHTDATARLLGTRAVGNIALCLFKQALGFLVVAGLGSSVGLVQHFTTVGFQGLPAKLFLLAHNVERLVERKLGLLFRGHLNHGRLHGRLFHRQLFLDDGDDFLFHGGRLFHVVVFDGHFFNDLFDRQLLNDHLFDGQLLKDHVLNDHLFDGLFGHFHDLFDGFGHIGLFGLKDGRLGDALGQCVLDRAFDQEVQVTSGIQIHVGFRHLGGDFLDHLFNDLFDSELSGHVFNGLFDERVHLVSQVHLGLGRNHLIDRLRLLDSHLDFFYRFFDGFFDNLVGEDIHVIA